MPRPPTLRLLALPVLLWALAGCLPPQASFQPGFGTTEVVGTMDLDPDTLAAGDGLVVVYKHHYTFITLDNGKTIRLPTANVVRVDREGRFSISMPSDVVAMDILFIAPDHLTDTFQFQRSLGVGRVTYRAHLPPMPDWRSHFYTYLEPQLQHLIVEQRYRLSPQDQKVLGDWLIAQQERLEAMRPSAQTPGKGKR
jgi:hypothetical protein